MEIEWTDLAQADLHEIIDYYGQFGRGAARRKVEPILRGISRLAVLPGLGPVARDLPPTGRYRHLVHGLYRVIYRVEAPRRILILRIWSSRRDPASLQFDD